MFAGVFAFVEVGTPLGLVTPSELAVPLAGAAAAAGAVRLLPLILVVWLCAAVGDSSGYLTGRVLSARVQTRLGGQRWQRHTPALPDLRRRQRVRVGRLGGRPVHAGWAFAASVDVLVAGVGQAGVALGLVLLAAAVLLAAGRRRQAQRPV